MSRSPVFVRLIAVVFLLAGCATEVQKPGFSQISFAHLQPISLNVARIEMENAIHGTGEEQPLEEFSGCFMRKLWWLEMVNFIEGLEGMGFWFS